MAWRRIAFNADQTARAEPMSEADIGRMRLTCAGLAGSLAPSACRRLNLQHHRQWRIRSATTRVRASPHVRARACSADESVAHPWHRQLVRGLTGRRTSEPPRPLRSIRAEAERSVGCASPNGQSLLVRLPKCARYCISCVLGCLSFFRLTPRHQRFADIWSTQGRGTFSVPMLAGASAP